MLKSGLLVYFFDEYAFRELVANRDNRDQAAWAFFPIFNHQLIKATAGWGRSCRFLGDSLLTPCRQWRAATMCFHTQQRHHKSCHTRSLFPSRSWHLFSHSVYFPSKAGCGSALTNKDTGSSALSSTVTWLESLCLLSTGGSTDTWRAHEKFDRDEWWHYLHGRHEIKSPTRPQWEISVDMVDWTILWLTVDNQRNVDRRRSLHRSVRRNSQTCFWACTNQQDRKSNSQ